MKTLRLVYRFSKQVPIVDVTSFVQGTSKAVSECQQVADALHKFGAVCIKDPRVNDQQNKDFLAMMENYFETRSKKVYAHHNIPDIFPQYSYQVGATPEFVEKARLHREVVQGYAKGNEAFTPQPPPFDAKWRFFWPIDDQWKKMKDSDFIPPRYTPEDIPNFQARMDSWGKAMINGCLTVAEMAALGLGLRMDTFSSKMHGGSHLLAPTGSDLLRYDVGTVFAGFHYDLNFLTIHGKSRYPGLFVWLRNGERVSVSVPEGHLLLQAGSQFDLMTGGYITCGYHEVIYTEEVKKRVEENQKKGTTTWRVSSTLFSHINPEAILQPVEKFAHSGLSEKYKPIKAYEQVMMELEAINLK